MSPRSRKNRKGKKTMLLERNYVHGELQESPFKREFRYLFCCTLAAIVIAFNLKSFIQTGNLFPGGFSGVTLLITRSLEKYAHIRVAYSLIYLPLNAFPIYIGLRYLGRRFTFYSIYVTVLSSILTDLLPNMPITYDIFLICIFSGIIGGVATLLCLYAGASAGGTDFISIFMSDKKGIDVWNYIFLFNVVILVIAGVLFGIERALYSIIYQFCATQMINTLYNRYQRKTLLVISEKAEEVCRAVERATHHAATILEGEGSYTGDVRKLIYLVVSAEEVNRTVKTIKETDPASFINVLKTDQLIGNFHRLPR